jgi:Nuclear pore complex scaffold, nucleoporins 186/192/205
VIYTHKETLEPYISRLTTTLGRQVFEGGPRWQHVAVEFLAILVAILGPTYDELILAHGLGFADDVNYASSTVLAALEASDCFARVTSLISPVEPQPRGIHLAHGQDNARSLVLYGEEGVLTAADRRIFQSTLEFCKQVAHTRDGVQKLLDANVFAQLGDLKYFENPPNEDFSFYGASGARMQQEENINFAQLLKPVLELFSVTCSTLRKRRVLVDCANFFLTNKGTVTHLLKLRAKV